jgi:RHS repeat-associated protein
LQSVTDPVNNVTSYVHDAANRLTTETDPLNHNTVYGYDAADEVTSITDRNNRQRQFVYDNAGRETQEKWLDSQNKVIRTIAYGYNTANDLTSASDSDSAYAFSYNNAGWLTSVDDQGTPSVPHIVLTYGYDAFGNRTSLSDNLGASVSYAYDPGARLTGLTLTDSLGNSAQVSLTYDNADRLTYVNRTAGGLAGNNVNTTLTYDNADRLTNIKHKYRTSTTLANYAYSFDAANQLTSYTGPDGTLNYSYDATGQLTGVTGAHTESYSFDLNGNRTMSGYVTTTGNRLQTDGTYNYTYDQEANMLTKTRISDGQSWNFTWDYRNRLTDVVVKNAAGTVLSSQHNTYDVFNRRIGVSTTINGVTTQMWTVYDGANTYADFDGSGNLTNRYLYGLAIDQLFGKIDASGNTRWYLTDMLGSVRLLTNPSGGVLDAVTYDSFGNILSETNPTNGDRFKFTGRELDGVSGQYYFRARYVDPGIGRFTTSDPLGFLGADANLFRYAFNITTTYIDPSGLLAAPAYQYPSFVHGGGGDLLLPPHLIPPHLPYNGMVPPPSRPVGPYENPEKEQEDWNKRKDDWITNDPELRKRHPQESRETDPEYRQRLLKESHKEYLEWAQKEKEARRKFDEEERRLEKERWDRFRRWAFTPREQPMREEHGGEQGPFPPGPRPPPPPRGR